MISASSPRPCLFNNSCWKHALFEAPSQVTLIVDRSYKYNIIIATKNTHMTIIFLVQAFWRAFYFYHQTDINIY